MEITEFWHCIVMIDGFFKQIVEILICTFVWWWQKKKNPPNLVLKYIPCRNMK